MPGPVARGGAAGQEGKKALAGSQVVRGGKGNDA